MVHADTLPSRPTPMRKVFAGLAILLAAVVVAQFFFAASGAFGIETDDGAYRPHHALGYVIFILAVVVAVGAALARVPGRLIALPAIVAGLTGLQVLIAELAKSSGDTAGQVIFGFHAVNGLAILAAAGITARRAYALARPASDSAHPEAGGAHPEAGRGARSEAGQEQ